MKYAFTMIEIIFVIIIISLIAIGAKNAIPDNTLINNSNYIKTKILDKRANALAYEVNLTASDIEDSYLVCMKFDRDWLATDESSSKVKFNFSKKVSITSDNNVCFDYLGRTHKDYINLDDFNTLLHNIVEINISYNNKYKTIWIYPMTGYTEIRN
jgi:prepilin-type N-terminal cleavage/methylation domain-containing protein